MGLIDAEVVSEETTFVPNGPKSGWCMSGHHLDCPAIFEAKPWPDPARKNATYLLPARRCGCTCHSRSLD